MTDAIVLGGSRGIGKAIAESLRSIQINVIATSSVDVDTSDLQSVRRFIQAHDSTDILVLNTGGPPPKPFEDITEDEWNRYHNQLFVAFCIILQDIKIRDGGYIFLISSGVVREPVIPNLVISSAYRAAFGQVFKILSRQYASRQVSCITVAPGLISTDRTKELLKSIPNIERSLPMGRMGRAEEIGGFVKGIVQNNVKYLSGVVIPFDGADSKYVF